MVETLKQDAGDGFMLFQQGSATNLHHKRPKKQQQKTKIKTHTQKNKETCFQPQLIFITTDHHHFCKKKKNTNKKTKGAITISLTI